MQEQGSGCRRRASGVGVAGGNACRARDLTASALSFCSKILILDRMSDRKFAFRDEQEKNAFNFIALEDRWLAGHGSRNLKHQIKRSMESLTRRPSMRRLSAPQ